MRLSLEIDPKLSVYGFGFEFFGSGVEFVVQQKISLTTGYTDALFFISSVQPVLKSSWLGFCNASGTTSGRYSDGSPVLPMYGG